MTRQTEDQKRGACLIIGGAGGIGSALARLLEEDGVPIVLAGRSEAPLHKLAEEIGARARVLDATNSDDLKAVVAEEGPLTSAVNCVGSILLKPAHLTTDDEYEYAFAQNVKTAFNLVRSAAPAMRKSGGSIVLMSSCAASAGLASHEVIAAAKAAVEGLTRAAAASYASWNVRVNAVAPGLVDTSLSAHITKKDAALEASRSMHPIGRIGAPNDIARAIRFLLDPEADWITGDVLHVDGGLSNLRSRATANG